MAFCRRTRSRPCWEKPGWGGWNSRWRHRWCSGAAGHFLVRGWNSVRTWHLNMFTLIGLGVGVSYLYSLGALLFARYVPPTLRAPDGSVNLYFEPAAVITTLVLLGQVLELKARSRTSSALKALLGLAPKTARVVLPQWPRRRSAAQRGSRRQHAAGAPGRKNSSGRCGAGRRQQRG